MLRKDATLLRAYQTWDCNSSGVMVNTTPRRYHARCHPDILFYDEIIAQMPLAPSVVAAEPMPRRRVQRRAHR